MLPIQWLRAIVVKTNRAEYTTTSQTDKLMSKQTVFDRIALIIALLLFALTMSGTRACQENYDFASQSTAATSTPTGSETPTGTETPDEDEDDIGVETPTPTSTETPTETPTVTPTESSVIVALRSLSKESEPDTALATVDSNIAKGAAAASSRKAGKKGNWLGQIYKEDIEGDSLDTDADGYTDLLESDVGSDPKDENSKPPLPVTFLSARFDGIDDDYDGLSNEDEREEGTDPEQRDSDGDGVLDGIEVLGQFDPKDPNSRPNETDGDGLSNQYEAEIGINPKSADSDGDSLRDDLEIIIGSNPLHNDSDGDGILDGREVELGSDPTIAER